MVSDQYAGFSDQEPWIKVNSDYLDWNVQSQEQDYDSVLNFYRRLSLLRHEHRSLTEGNWKELVPNHPHVLAYIRETKEERAFVLLNFSKHAQTVRFKDTVLPETRSVLSNYDFRKAETTMKLLPYEAHLWFF